MKLVTRIAAAFAVLLLPALASAQEAQPQHPLAGHWAGQVALAGQDREIVVEFTIEGEAVTGPIIAAQIGEFIIRNGSVTGNSIHFTSPNIAPLGEGPALVWSGQLTGANELAFSVVTESGEGQASEFVLTKRVAQ
ncbi:MAG TPA: hypothetical protein VNT81_00920 [Vicinamibacterales bacterium]|nr:hypothetical protein [Vicinamibacterales bacterium]